MYSGAKEEVPHDVPEPKGKHVTTTTVGSTQVPFLMCTLEIPQKLAAQDLALNFCYHLLLSLFSNNELSCIFVFASSFIHMDLSIIQPQHP